MFGKYDTIRGLPLRHRNVSRTCSCISVHGASRHGTMASHPVAQHHSTSQTSQSQCITERSPSRTISSWMHVNVVSVSRRVTLFPSGNWLSAKDIPAQCFTEDHSTPWRITEDHRDHGTSWTSQNSSWSITERSPSRTSTARINTIDSRFAVAREFEHIESVS